MPGPRKLNGAKDPSGGRAPARGEQARGGQEAARVGQARGAPASPGDAEPPAKPGAARAKDRADSRSPLVGVIMGSRTDWETMRHASDALTALNVPHECRVVSAHRTPDHLFEYASGAHSRGLEVIIAGAGGAAHLPGMAAAKTILPVLGVPMESAALKGMDSLLSIVQMPAGVPVGTLAIGKAGAINAALLAAAILGASRPEIRERLREYRERQTAAVLSHTDPATMPHPPRPRAGRAAGA